MLFSPLYYSNNSRIYHAIRLLGLVIKHIDAAKSQPRRPSLLAAQAPVSTPRPLYCRLSSHFLVESSSPSFFIQNIVSQLHMPAPIETRHQISSMKEAVDSQELKIQTSLVNEEDVLGNITNRALHRQRHSHPEK